MKITSREDALEIAIKSKYWATRGTFYHITNFCAGGDMAEIITCAIFVIRLRGYRIHTPQNWPYRLTCYIVVTTVRHCYTIHCNDY